MATGDVTVEIVTPYGLKGAVFDGVDDYIDVPNISSSFFQKGFSIFVRLFARTYGTASLGRILSKTDSPLHSDK